MDYQPGGSSGVNEHSDPLSNPAFCARDIFLFQELGINTIRVYSVNPELNHDKCMTLLAAAGIYLVLDVNSPIVGQHLNRYEPWTTYNDKYMNHVFRVLNEFAGYNNTLAFFAGNEIVNDKTSATNSPVYIKAVVRDMKHFIKTNKIRTIPVGYSAADDLSYRISLANYLECYETDPLETVDFYGVNTYQWCGEQTFYTSGYNNLVRDYSSYSKPIFFSEYGCNEVLPRLFKEISSIYSTDMTSVFSGGLVYEFAQEPNNYGLVDYDELGNVKLLPDFFAFKDQISKVKDVPLSKKLLLQNQQVFEGRNNRKQKSKRKVCELQYENLDISKGIPRSMGNSIVKTFATQKKGNYVPLTQEDMTCNFKVFSVDGTLLNKKPVVKAVPEPTADPQESISCEYCEETVKEVNENGVDKSEKGTDQKEKGLRKKKAIDTEKEKNDNDRKNSKRKTKLKSKSKPKSGSKSRAKPKLNSQPQFKPNSKSALTHKTRFKTNAKLQQNPKSKKVDSGVKINSKAKSKAQAKVKARTKAKTKASFNLKDGKGRISDNDFDIINKRNHAGN